ncbi:hypothetical protein KY289_007790 [Solanum tuberosum]|nr:hypothetical protein KY289_007790 [Solanum tuberosum]
MAIVLEVPGGDSNQCANANGHAAYLQFFPTCLILSLIMCMILLRSLSVFSKLPIFSFPNYHVQTVFRAFPEALHFHPSII